LNTVQEAIIVTDKANNITQINTSAIRLLELDRANLIDQPILSIFPTLNFPLPQTNCSQFDTKNTCQNADRTKQFYINVEIITDPGNKDYLGSVVVLKSLNQVRAITNKFNPNYSKYCFDDIKGSSASIENVKEKLRKAALTDATILIRGESGTGKELFAHAIHAASHRAKNNFTAINCSAIPDALLESELFGYEEGAFTGAKKGGKPGKLELAKGGTIFLDEIGDMPLHLQCKLLRVIENRIIERVGGTEQILVDVRFIAATNKDLEKMVAENDFRSDLYYRLSVIPVMVPPLRDRGGDIGILINYFLNMYSNKMNIPEPIIDQQVKEVLLNYAWPGNVREMQNTLQYLISMSQDEPIATMKHLPSKFFEISAHTQSNDKMLNQTEELFDLNIAGKGTLHSAQEQLVGQALQKFGCTTEGKVKAAKYLGISLTTLYRKIREINDSNNLQNLN
jgi:transcriptional regulator with PAS, ATPase and Fis domain